MIISDLYKLNRLKEISSILLNNKIEPDFYDYYFNNSLNWLLDNQEKIENDLKNNIEKLKFDIIFSKLEERFELILSLQNATIDEFSKYIDFIPFNVLKKRKQQQIIKKFETFKSLTNDYEKIEYFKKICR